MRALRAAYLLAAVLILVLLPISEPTVMLALFVAVDLAAAALFLPDITPEPSRVVAIGNSTNMPLLRRTVPELRSRRPAVVIEAQTQWRQAAEFRRRRSVVRRAER